ncbi:hypothetical protein CV044_02375 [Achromobacter ruhlandii]|nr:hypothetical protein CV044_02375 [Achromobacter ruhlandii]
MRRALRRGILGAPAEISRGRGGRQCGGRSRRYCRHGGGWPRRRRPRRRGARPCPRPGRSRRAGRRRDGRGGRRRRHGRCRRCSRRWRRG